MLGRQVEAGDLVDGETNVFQRLGQRFAGAVRLHRSVVVFLVLVNGQRTSGFRVNVVQGNLGVGGGAQPGQHTAGADQAARGDKRECLFSLFHD